MRKAYFVVASLAGLTLTVLSPASIKAAPLTGAYAPAVDDNVISVARRCWRRANGRLVCTFKRPYWQPDGYYPAYRYGYYRPYYQPYGYYPAYPYGYLGYSNLGPYYQPYYRRFYMPGYYPYGYYGVW